jgi:hypothetical protein
MKFREHRGGLDESLATTVELEPTKDALNAQLQQRYGEWWKFNEDDVSVKPYSFDVRIGWDTHIVCIKGAAVGYTDGPLSERRGEG